MFQDSFFSPDSRGESSNPSGFGPLSATASARQPRGAEREGPATGNPDDIVGVVVDTPRHGNRPPRH